MNYQLLLLFVSENAVNCDDRQERERERDWVSEQERESKNEKSIELAVMRTCVLLHRSTHTASIMLIEKIK